MTELDDAIAAEAAGAEIDLRRVAALVGAIADGDGRLIARELAELHPADAADALEQLSPEQLRSAAALAPEAFSPEVLAELDWETREIALERLPTAQLVEAVTELESDDATLIVDGLSDERREEVLAEVSEQDRRAVEDGLAFEEDEVGRLMQREFVAAPEFWTVGDAIDHMRGAGEHGLPDTFFEIYVVDPGFRPVGAVALSMLLRSARDTKLADIMVAPAARITPDMDREDAAFPFQKYHLAQAPVVDEAGRLTGILTIDDVVDVLEEEHHEDVLALAGVADTSLAATAIDQMRARAPWLFVNLCAAIAASAVISLFGPTIERIVALAILMPIVSALGGSAGTQTLAVAVRALTARTLTAANARRTVVREVTAAALNGLIFAAVLALVAGVWFRDPGVAGVIGIAMALTFVWGGFMGILAPLTLKRLGADPAVSSSVFVTATTDMVGFFLFLGLATVVLL